jgi:hypothetical protein
MALEDAQSACRSFASFAGILKGMPEDASDANGEVGGMVQDATQAVDTGSATARWSKLVSDLEALQAVTTAAKWPVSTAATRLPQIAVVQSDCKSIGSG